MLKYNTLPSLCRGQITLSNIDEICPLAIPNQIPTISMHIPSLVRIDWCLLKLSSGNEIQMDGLTTDGWTDGQTHGCPAWNHNTQPLSLAGYKEKDIFLISFFMKYVCCAYSYEWPHWGASNEYLQHMLLWRNKKDISLLLQLTCSFV